MFDPFNFFEGSGEDGTRLFLDMVLAMVIILLLMIMIMIPFINDPGKEKENEIDPPGNVIIEIYWDDEVNIDIDGWVKGPEDLLPVGFSHRSDVMFNLLRDDRGTYLDHSGENYENYYSRGVVAGQYIFDVHWYGGTEVQELDVKVLVSVVKKNEMGKKDSTQILVTTVTLDIKEYKNVFVFELDAQGELVPGSVYTDPSIRLKQNESYGPGGF